LPLLKKERQSEVTPVLDKQEWCSVMQQQIPYRGYSIKTERKDLCWTFRLEKTHPELPVFEDQKFRTATQSESLAVAQAKQRIDSALEAWKPIS
jgi:hypothetical protein